MSKYLIENIKHGINNEGVVIVTIQYKKDDGASNWLSIADAMGFPTISSDDFDSFDLLMSGDIDNPKYATGFIDTFEGITLGLYDDIFDSIYENTNNTASSLIKFLIALTCYGDEELKNMISIAKGKYINEVNIPISYREEEYLENLDEE